MKKQHIILLGIAICFAGVFLDGMVTRYAFLLIHLGTAFAVYGTIGWLRIAENRKQVNKYFFARGGSFAEKIKNVFDFSWARLSILWTACGLMGILIVHIGALAMGNSAAYEEAIETVKTDVKVLEQTGEILGFSYMITGNTTPNGRSTLNFGIIGSEKNIKVTVAVNSSNGQYVTKKIKIK